MMRIIFGALLLLTILFWFVAPSHADPRWGWGHEWRGGWGHPEWHYAPGGGFLGGVVGGMVGNALGNLFRPSEPAPQGPCPPSYRVIDGRTGAYIGADGYEHYCAR